MSTRSAMNASREPGSTLERSGNDQHRAPRRVVGAGLIGPGPEVFAARALLGLG